MINENLLAILHADKQARERKAGALLSEKEAEQNLEEAKARFEKLYHEKVEERVLAAEQAYKAAYLAAQKQAADRLCEAEKTLDALHSEKKKAWVEQIVQDVLA